MMGPSDVVYMEKRCMCPVMICFTGGSDDSKCQKRQIDLAI